MGILSLSITLLLAGKACHRHLLFFVTYEWDQKVTFLHYYRLKRLAIGKHSSLLGSFVSYDENQVFSIRPLESVLQKTQTYKLFLQQSCQYKPERQ